MTHTEQAKFIGLTAYVNYDGMLFKAKVIDVRQVWGDTQVLLVPVWGDEDKSVAQDIDDVVGLAQSDTAKGAAWKATGSVRLAHVYR